MRSAESKCKVTGIEGNTVVYEDPDGKVCRVSGDKILVSVGRRAVLKGYGLENLGVAAERGIKVDEHMRTNIPNVYAAGDVRDKYLRQVSTAISDGAVAATAAERYIEDLDYFREQVLESPEPVVLGFWSPEYAGSIDAISNLSTPYRVMEVDVSRKKTWADRYHISLDENTPAVALVVDKGEVREQLKL